MKKYNYIVIPSDILKNGLTVSELTVAVYLFSLLRRDKKNSYGMYVKVKQTTIARCCNVSKETAARALKKLLGIGIISRRIRGIKENRHLGTCSYVLPDPRKGRFFKANRTAIKLIFASGLSLLKTYLYCCLSASSDDKEQFFHSYSDIAAAVGSRRSDIISSVKCLVKMGILIKRCRKTRSGDYTENLYCLSNKKEKPPTHISKKKEANLYTRIISHYIAVVKRYFISFRKKVCESVYYFFRGGV